MENVYNVYIFSLFESSRGGISKQKIKTFFILVDERSLITLVYKIIKIWSKKGWKQELWTARVYQWFCYNFSRIQKKIFIIWNHLVSYPGDFLSIKGLKAKPKICDQQCLAHIESYQMIKRKMDEWNISTLFKQFFNTL